MKTIPLPAYSRRYGILPRGFFPILSILLLFCLACPNIPSRPDEEYPLVEILVNNTPESIDDYIRTGPANRVPCQIRLTNHQLFNADVEVRLQSLETTNGGRIEFSTTLAGTGAANITRTLPHDGTLVDFYVIGITAPPSNSVFGDIAIEVIENRATLDEVVLARHAVMVTNSLPAIPVPKIVLEINGSPQTIDDYLTWSPLYCRVKIANPADVSGDLAVTLVSASYGGQVAFAATGSLTPHTGSPSASSLNLTLPASGDWVEFYAAGTFDDTRPLGAASIRDKDAIVEIRTATELLGRWCTMVRVRKNANTITAPERDRLLLAIAKLNQQFARYQEFIQRHLVGNSEAHTGPGFLPWHRAFVLQLERELQSIDPSVALHYWRFDQGAPNVFHQDFMGESYNYIDPDIGTPVSPSDDVTFSALNPLFNWESSGVPGIVRRTLFLASDPAGVPICGGTADVEDEVATLARGGGLYHIAAGGGFRDMEENPHGYAHVLAGGFNIDNCGAFNVTPIGYITDVLISPRDPLFFLLHSQVDHLWAKWQWINDRLDPADPNALSPTGIFPNGSCNAASTFHIGHYAEDVMWPWNQLSGPGAVGGCVQDDRPAAGSTLRVFPNAPGTIFYPPGTPRPRDMVDYRSGRFLGTTPVTSVNSGMGFAYDDVDY